METNSGLSQSPAGISSADPGADVQRRFRYQAAYTAIIATELLNDDSNVKLVFCEHHEDVLVQQTDDKFVGIQVKTRETGLNPFKTGDEEIRSALKRFLHLEVDFPDHFVTFVIAANCGFYSTKKTTSNLTHFAETVCTASQSKKEFPKSEASALKKLAAKLECTADALAKILCKLELRGDLPQFGDIFAVLARRISQTREIQEYTYREVNAVADAILNRVLEASALSCDDSARLCLLLARNVDREETEAIIKRKTITRSTITSLLLETASTSRLTCVTTTSVDALPQGTRLLQQKMAAGGVSVENIALATDHKVSAEFLLQQWFFKYGNHEANSRYRHLRTIVRTEAYEARDEAVTEDQLYGAAMLEKIRNRLRVRQQTESSSLFGVYYEHLLGVAGILTEECVLWWSKPFSIESLE